MSNNDNAMTRFLFAILKQKNLKDIDWNQVARDPILAQEITNGHAARMRYSRFRAAMLGLEPQRRNRPSTKPRATKPKKDVKTKKEDNIKSESGGSEAGDIVAGARVKQEASQASYDARFSPASSSVATSAAMPHIVQPRLLTPSSDTDAFSQNMAPSPTSDMFNSQGGFDFTAPLCGHDPAGWQHPAMYSPFEPAHDFDTFSIGYDHSHLHHTSDLFASQSLADMGADQLMVKHEEWDSQC